MTPQQLAEENVGFVVKVARHYAGMGLSLEDLIAEGNVGLIEAAHHYDPSRGAKFITYAVWWIRKAILAALSRQAAIRLPGSQRRKIRAVFDAERDIVAETCAGAGREAVARRLGTSIERVDRALTLKSREVAGDAAVHAGATMSIFDSIPDRSTCPEAALLRRENRDLVRRLLRGLSDHERHVLAARHGLDGGPGRSLREIGRARGVSCEAVRLIEKRAGHKLRRALLRGPGAETRRPRPRFTRVRTENRGPGTPRPDA